MAEFVYGIPEHVDRIEGLVDLDRPPLCLVDFDEREEHIKLVTLLRTLRCSPTGLDRCEPNLACSQNGNKGFVSGRPHVSGIVQDRKTRMRKIRRFVLINPRGEVYPFA